MSWGRILGGLVLITILAMSAAYYWTTKLPVTGVLMAGNGMAVSVDASSQTNFDPTKLVGRPMMIRTKSLGNIDTAVCSILQAPSSTTYVIVPAANAASAIPAGASYVPDAGDMVYVW